MRYIRHSFRNGHERRVSSIQWTPRNETRPGTVVCTFNRISTTSVAGEWAPVGTAPDSAQSHASVSRGSTVASATTALTENVGDETNPMPPLGPGGQSRRPDGGPDRDPERWRLSPERGGRSRALTRTNPRRTAREQSSRRVRPGAHRRRLDRRGIRYRGEQRGRAGGSCHRRCLGPGERPAPTPIGRAI